MSVRGSKHKRLEEMEKLYERCHLNEESLSAQLQGDILSLKETFPSKALESQFVSYIKLNRDNNSRDWTFFYLQLTESGALTFNLEYKVRLEKSLQQEKNEHIQIKDDLQNKLEEERQAREKDNLESINKFTALQQKYKFLQSQHEDTNAECNKLRQLQLSELEEKSRLDSQLLSMKNEIKLLRENKEKDFKLLKEKNSELENENAVLRADKMKLLSELNGFDKHKSVGIKLPEKLPLNSSAHKAADELSNMQSPDSENKLNLSSTKSSTSANKAEQEFFPSGNNIYLNTSTPMINPDAVLSQDKILSAAFVPQPRQESLRNFNVPENNENVGAKPEQFSKQRINDDVLVQGVLRAPDIMNDFGHVPAVQQYKDKLRQRVERNNNGGEVGDEGEPVVKNPENKKKRPWREDDIEGIPFVRHPAGNDPYKNEVYHYQADYDMKKEEGEDDDDADPLDYQHMNEKSHQQEKKANVGEYVKIPLKNQHESVMIQPK